MYLQDVYKRQASGIEAVKQINAWHPDSQIIYITNHVTYFSSVYETSHIFYILKKDIDKYLQIALKKAIRHLKKINQLYLIIHTKQNDIRLPQSKILYLSLIHIYKNSPKLLHYLLK